MIIRDFMFFLGTLTFTVMFLLSWTKFFLKLLIDLLIHESIFLENAWVSYSHKNRQNDNFPKIMWTWVLGVGHFHKLTLEGVFNIWKWGEGGGVLTPQTFFKYFFIKKVLSLLLRYVISSPIKSIIVHLFIFVTFLVFYL